MNIDNIYEAARARGLARSKRHFSKALLGRAPNYLADRRSYEIRVISSAGSAWATNGTRCAV